MLKMFISHSWSYDDTYDKLCGLLNNQQFPFNDYSIPKDDPIHSNGTDTQLEMAIDSKISGANGVLVLAGVYSKYSKWIQKELRIARKYNKPIIVVEPWGSERTSIEVRNVADGIVGWDGAAIVETIRKYVM